MHHNIFPGSLRKSSNSNYIQLITKHRSSTPNMANFGFDLSAATIGKFSKGAEKKTYW